MVRVIIERWVDPTLLKPFKKQLIEIRQQIIQQPGYLAAETFQDLEDPGHWIVMAKWACREDWQAWADSVERQNQLALIDSLMVKPEKVTVVAPR